MKLKNMSSFDLLGNLAIIKFPKEFSLKEKKKSAEGLLRKHKQVKTVLEKIGKIKGRLRKIQTRYLAGDKTKEVLYRENGCVFRFNIDSTYFSPRLSGERMEITKKIKKDDNVFVMFAGVAPFSIVIAKRSKAKKVYSNELNREANKYAKLNIDLNKLSDKVELVPGDVKGAVGKFLRQKKKFNVIVMPRPQLKDSFLNEAFKVSKKGTRIFYYDFYDNDKIHEMKEKILEEAKKSKKKVKILKVKTAGEIAPYRSRFRVDLKIY